jgi:hypothetical protein
LALTCQAAIKQADKGLDGPIAEVLEVFNDDEIGGAAGSDLLARRTSSGSRDIRRLQDSHLKIRRLASDLGNKISDEVCLTGAGRTVEEQGVDSPPRRTATNALVYSLRGLPCGTVLRQQNPNGPRLHVLAFPLRGIAAPG